MFSTCVAFAGLACVHSAYGEAQQQFHGHISSEKWLPREPIGDALPAEHFVAEEALPKHFDWRNVNGKSYVVADWNQHIPQYCGACWIHGTVSALNDRIKVLRGGRYPDIMLGRQVVVNCVPPADGKGSNPGCQGGDAWMIHQYMHKNKIPDESCMPYQARNMNCEPKNVCRNCAPNGTCWSVDNYIGYSVSSYGKVSGENAMMKEIYTRGPIVCSFATDDNFMFKYSEVALQNEGVYFDGKKYNESQIDHDMEVVGWGETPSGVKFWSVRNSWGTYWGEAGWLKLRRGTNELLSESDCAWAVPTFDDLDEALTGKVLGDYVLGDLPLGETAQRIDANSPAMSSLTAVATRSPYMILCASFAFFAGVGMTSVVLKVTARARSSRQPLLLG